VSRPRTRREGEEPHDDDLLGSETPADPVGEKASAGTGGSPAARGPLTTLLAEASGGDADALNRLFPLVYDELRQVARARLRGERLDHTLAPTALVHEAYMRLVDQKKVQWQNRGHFFAVASEAMRRILVDHARMKQAGKRGGGAAHVPFDDAAALALDPAEDLVALDAALDKLKAFNPRGAEVVVHRFFGGLRNDEIATILGVSEVTVRRAWSTAKAWLRRELRSERTAMDPLPSADHDAT
jgi:RNA polymerase sigma-70 factor, ECF subfamily